MEGAAVIVKGGCSLVFGSCEGNTGNGEVVVMVKVMGLCGGC